MQKRNYAIVGMIILLLACLLGCTTTMKANSLLEQKNYRGAIELYREYLTQNPGDFRVRSKLGFACFKASMLDNAAEEFESALRMKPGDPFSTLYLGATCLKQKKLSQAMAIWENYKDSERPLVEKEIRQQLALLRVAWDKDRAFKKAEQISTSYKSTKPAAKQFAIQMDKSIRKIESAWEKANSAALPMEDEVGDGDGGG